MKAYRLALVKDQAIPRFQRLIYREVDVTLRDVLLRGVHPVDLCCTDTGRDGSRISEVILDRLDQPEFLIASFQELQFSNQCGTPLLRRDIATDSSGALLAHLRAHLYFVEELTFEELVTIAKRRLQDRWNSNTAAAVLNAKLGDSFNTVRRFIKEKAPNIKLTGWNDLAAIDLSRLLSLDEFRDDEMALIRYGIPGVVNFRRTSFLDSVILDDGLLSVRRPIESFVLHVPDPAAPKRSVTYHGFLRNGMIRLLPSEFTTGPDAADRRALARRITREYGGDSGTFCLTTPIERVEELVAGGARLRFSNLRYKDPPQELRPATPVAKNSQVSIVYVGSPLSASSPAERLRNVLRHRGAKVSGTKAEIVDRLADLLTEEYGTLSSMLDDFFRQRFIRIHQSSTQSRLSMSSLLVSSPTPVPTTEGGFLFRQTVLTMYILKHMRGNRIVDREYENDSYGMRDLALAILRGDVRLEGNLVPV